MTVYSHIYKVPGKLDFVLTSNTEKYVFDLQSMYIRVLSYYSYEQKSPCVLINLPSKIRYTKIYEQIKFR